MAESSRFWNTNNIGDGPTAGFDRDAVASWLRNIFAQGGAGGVLRGVLNELAVSGSSSPLAVNTGAAIVYGLYYWNTASVNLTVTTPSVGTTGGHVILRVSWSAQTVRLVAVRNTDGTAAIPALTQTPGTTYEIRLATFTITTGGVITLTDARSYATYSDSPRMDSLARLAALSVIARASSTTGQSAALAPSTDGYVLRRSGSSLAFGQIATAGLATGAINSAKLPANAVDNLKVGNRVPQFYRRQGGDASDWSVQGSTAYTPGAVRIQGGAETHYIPDTGTTRFTSITFPVAFSAAPLVFVTPVVNTTYYLSIVIYSISATSVTFLMVSSTSVSPALQIDYHWMAIGPE